MRANAPSIVYRPTTRVVIPKVEADPMKFSESSREFLHYFRAVQGMSQATVDNYGRTYHQFLSHLRELELTDHTKNFTSDTVFSFCDDLGKRGAAGNTILNKLHALRTLGKYLLKRKDGRGPAILTLPTDGFAWPKETQPKTHFLYPQELAPLMALPLDAETHLLRAVLAETGIRALEACEANLGDVKEIDGEVYLALKVKGRRSVNAEPASIPLSPATATLLAETLERRGRGAADAPLFVTPDEQRYKRTQLSQLFIRLGKRAGITRITSSPHRLRHTANVVARISGVDAVTRAAMLNHRSLRTLARYDHLVPGETAKGRTVARQGLDDYLAQGHVDAALRHTPSDPLSKPAE